MARVSKVQRRDWKSAFQWFGRSKFICIKVIQAHRHRSNLQQGPETLCAQRRQQLKFASTASSLGSGLFRLIAFIYRLLRLQCLLPRLLPLLLGPVVAFVDTDRRMVFPSTGTLCGGLQSVDATYCNLKAAARPGSSIELHNGSCSTRFSKGTPID
jgi:hypothetical protein